MKDRDVTNWVYVNNLSDRTEESRHRAYFITHSVDGSEN